MDVYNNSINESCETKCEDQKVVGWKESGESCRLVRGKVEVLLEFLLLAVR